MSIARKLVSALTLFALYEAPAFARDIYISPTGVDSNTTVGDFGHPFKSPYFVANYVVAAGDTVYFMSGKYSRFIAKVDGTSDSNRITWKAYPGQTPEIVIGPEAWYGIAIQANYQTIDGLTVTGYNDSVTLAQAEADYNKQIPMWFVRNPANGKNDINPATGQKVTVDTPNPAYVAGYYGSGSFNSSGISASGAPNKGHHLTVINTVVRKCGCGGLGSTDVDYTVFKNNRVYDNAWYSNSGCSGMGTMMKNEDPNDTFTGYRNVITNNIMWNNRGLVKWVASYKDSQGVTRRADGAYSDGNGFIFDVAKLDSAGGVYKGRSLFANNLMVHNGGSGVHVFLSRNVDVVNNTAYMNGDKVNYPDIFGAYANDAHFYNNIVYARPGGKINSLNRDSNVTYDYNVYFVNGSSIYPGSQGAHDVLADPIFVAPTLTPCLPRDGAGLPNVDCSAAAGFQLRGDSPAIDGGNSIPGMTPLVDIQGVTRPAGNGTPYVRVGSGLDMGAYEYNNPARIPTASTTVNGKVNQFLSFSIVAYNWPKAYGATTLPAGLTLNTTTGVISGTPTAAAVGTRTVTISATNAVGQGTAKITFFIAGPTT